MAHCDDGTFASDESRLGLSIPHRPVLLRGRQVALFCGTQQQGCCEEHSHPWIQATFLRDSLSCAVVHREASGQVFERTFTGRHVWCIAPDISHSERWGGESLILEVYFSPQFVAGLPSEDVMAVLVRESLDSTPCDDLLWMLVSSLMQLHAETPRPSLELLETVALTLGRRLFQRHGRNAARFSGTKLPPDRLECVLTYIKKCLGDTIRIPKLASLASLSAAHFSEVFRNTMGLSPKFYVREQRLIKAHEMVLRAELRLGGIADICGFVDTSHLNREFSKFFGYLPRYLRNRGIAANDTGKAGPDTSP